MLQRAHTGLGGLVEMEPQFREFTVIIERDEEGYYVASVPELPGCHTQARTVEELMERIKEAITLYLESEGVPEIVETRKVRIKLPP